MASLRELWGSIGVCGDLLEPVVTYGDLSGYIRTYGGLWVSGNRWRHMATFGSLRGPMQTYGDLYRSMRTYE